ncbi:hypothetical protein K503DRAFT_798835 [Rhizopogon vinicolor AM-OR11-026]|uniref:DUF6534 domain-containing protein n=1 Tax=Rhizopogon vinicolor AM-OR11-026 TaxID=1314800 RepID=A0A1B7N6F0_9AGAM|nr:hypothetical protein K503DRAFT_798835 [Rhizopogon vinicolor AM-OR11-026]
MGEMISLESYAEFSLPFPGWIFALGLTLSAIVDIMITSSLCYFLRKNRTTITKLTYSYPSNRTIYVIDTLTSWTIQNGSITCAGTVASLLCWEAMPQNRIFLGLHFAVAKFYANSLLATLNARQQMRDARQYGSPDSRPLPVLSPEDFGNIPRTFRSPYGFSTRFDPRQLRAGDLKYGQPIQVNVERVVDSKYDDDGIKLEEPRSHADGDSAV